MKTTFFLSQNARFLLGAEGRDIILLKEEKEVWTRKIAYVNFEIIGVGNNGKVAIKTDDGVVIYPVEPDKDGALIHAFARQALESENADLAKVVLDRTGERLCFEKVSQRSKLTEKLFKILSSSPRLEKGQALHELIFYEIATGKQTVFYKFAVDRKIPHAFSWNISPDFHYLIWGEAQKAFKGTETKFSAADVVQGSIFEQFILEGLTEWILIINNQGSFLIDSPQKRETRQLLVGTKQARNYKLTIQNEYKASYLGREFIAFQSRMEPKAIFKRFNNTVIQEVDFSALRELNFEFQVLFSEKDDIVLVTKKDADVKLLFTSLDRIAIDAKRWQKTAEEQKIDLEIEKKKTALEEKQKVLKEQKAKMKAEELSKTVLEHKKTRLSKQLNLIAEKEKQLDDLKIQFKLGMIRNYDYLKQKKQIEMEIAELKGEEVAIPAERTRLMDEFQTKPLTEPGILGVPTPIALPKGVETQYLDFGTKELVDAPNGKTMEQIRIEQELQEYMPLVQPKPIAKPLEIEPARDNGAFLQSVPKAPQRRKKVPERIELEVTSKKKAQDKSPEYEIDKTQEKTIPEASAPLERLIEQKVPKTIEVKEKQTATRIAPISPKALEPPVSDRASPVATKRLEGISGSTSDLTARKTGELPDIKIDIPTRSLNTSPVSVRGVEEDERLIEMRRQIEREIQEAVSRKKQDSKRSEEQKQKYMKLLKELEDSYALGVISKENYLQLKKKYEEKLEAIEKEMQG